MFWAEKYVRKRLAYFRFYRLANKFNSIYHDRRKQTRSYICTLRLELRDDLTGKAHCHVRQQTRDKFNTTTEPVVNELDEDVRHVGHPVKNSAGCCCVVCWKTITIQKQRAKNQT